MKVILQVLFNEPWWLFSGIVSWKHFVEHHGHCYQLGCLREFYYLLWVKLHYVRCILLLCYCLLVKLFVWVACSVKVLRLLTLFHHCMMLMSSLTLYIAQMKALMSFYYILCEGHKCLMVDYLSTTVALWNDTVILHRAYHIHMHVISVTLMGLMHMQSHLSGAFFDGTVLKVGVNFMHRAS